MARKPPAMCTSGRIIKKPMMERSSSTWTTSSAGVVARPATDISRKQVIEPAIQAAAFRFDCSGAMPRFLQARRAAATLRCGYRLGQLFVFHLLGWMRAAALAKGVARLHGLRAELVAQ